MRVTPPDLSDTTPPEKLGPSTQDLTSILLRFRARPHSFDSTPQAILELREFNWTPPLPTSTPGSDASSPLPGAPSGGIPAPGLLIPFDSPLNDFAIELDHGFSSLQARIATLEGLHEDGESHEWYHLSDTFRTHEQDFHAPNNPAPSPTASPADTASTAPQATSSSPSPSPDDPTTDELTMLGPYPWDTAIPVAAHIAHADWPVSIQPNPHIPGGKMAHRRYTVYVPAGTPTELLPLVETAAYERAIAEAEEISHEDPVLLSVEIDIESGSSPDARKGLSHIVSLHEAMLRHPDESMTVRVDGRERELNKLGWRS